MKWFIAVVAVAVMTACVSADVRFKNKVVLVTGGSSGIGFQTALQFAQEGASVIIAARDSQKEHYSGDQAVKAITDDETVKANGGDARFVQCDVSKTDQVAALFDNIRQNENALDIAVNGAGISGPLGHIAETSEFTLGVHDPILNNLYGVMNCLPFEEQIMMEKAVNASIVNIAAIQGVTPNSTLPRYTAAAHAIVGLTKSLALKHITGEDGFFIRVNAIAPGVTATPFAFNMVKSKQQPWEGEWVTEDSDTWKNALAGVVLHTPMQRVARPSEIANAILWLCTEDAVHVSADTLIVDGGFWAT